MTDARWQHLQDHARARVRAGLRRTLRPRSYDQQLIDLASNDYLSLSQDPRIMAATVDAVARWGTGAKASRLVAGSTQLHTDLELDLVQHTGTAAALVFSTGYAANLGVITALCDADTLLVSDAYNHASIIDAARLSRASVSVVPHLSVTAVAQALGSRTQSRALVVTESVFSVDGDAADLASLYQVCEEYGAVLLVDEAHSLGVVGASGAGSVAAAGLAGAPGLVISATLSKSLAASGGAVLGEQIVIDHLVDTARTFIFDTALPPASAAASAAVLRLLNREPELPTRLREITTQLHETAVASGWTATAPHAAVLSLQVGDPQAAVAEQARWRAAGVDVGVFRPPSVPDGISRLRLTGKAGLTNADLTVVESLLRAGPPHSETKEPESRSRDLSNEPLVDLSDAATEVPLS
ncbi:8-amino-7-oxononanoate synthase [Candidatus Nanopelagicales bacterium]|nr:8-amino-7-oxononanoate synthase [Candidatus Nanopelagicales bacterium]